MKAFLALTMTFALTLSAQAKDLNQNALEALLSTPGVQVSGDVHAHETLESIYKGAVSNGAKVQNECIILNSRIADCTLWLTFSPMGETAVLYSVYLPGDKLVSTIVEVARGD